MRNSVIGKVGKEKVALDPAPAGSKRATVQLLDTKGRLRHGLGNLVAELDRLGMTPTEIGVDLLIIAALVYAADTRISRKDTSQDSWTREIDVHVPVSDRAIWEQNALLLSSILGFVSGDKWRLFFRSRKPLLPKKLVYPNVPFDAVALFSGGLDSFIGAIDQLKAKKKTLFVAHYAENGKVQENCHSVLQKEFPKQSHLIQAFLSYDAELLAGSEDSQRARSFLFFSLAVAAATAFRKQLEIVVPENGLISLNIPFDFLRLGSFSTRTTHPFYMARWNELLVKLGLPITLENPYRFQTKGEMCLETSARGFLKSNYTGTMSCASPGKSRFRFRKGFVHCGHCVPCLIRKAALLAAFKSDDTVYAVDVSSDEISSNKASGEQVRSILFAIREIKSRKNRQHFAVRRTGPLSDYMETEIEKYEDVYARGLKELEKLLKGVEVAPST